MLFRSLGREKIDIFFLHRLDPKVAVEESVGAMRQLQIAGKIGAIGLCETSAATLRRAQKEAQITMLPAVCANSLAGFRASLSRCGRVLFRQVRGVDREKTDLCAALQGVFTTAKFSLRHRHAGGFRVCAEALPDKL